MILDADGRPMVPVHVCWSDWEAEVIIGLLRAHDIGAQANSEIPHAVLPTTADGLGEIQILVIQEDALRARDVIQEQKSAIESSSDNERPEQAG